MTRPLPPHPGPRPRIALACLPCRRAKVKCDGKAPMQQQHSQEGENPTATSAPCTKCLKSGLDCTWMPSRRTGSKRRAGRGEEGLMTGHAVAEMGVCDGDPVNAREGGGLDTESAAVVTAVDPHNDHLQVQSAMPQVPLDQLLLPDNPEMALAYEHSVHYTHNDMGPLPTYPHHHHRQPTNENPPFPVYNPSDAERNEIAALYYTHVHHFCCILPPYSVFISNPRRSSPLVVAAMGALAAHYAPAPFAVNYVELAANLLSSPYPQTSHIDRIQASILFVHVAYGSGDAHRAREYLASAVRIAVENGIHIRDRVLFDSTAASSPDMAETERRLWWEIWTLDGMLQVVSGVHKSVLAHVPNPAVNVPAAWRSIGADEQLSAFMLRARTISILLNASDPTAMRGLSHAAQEHRSKAIITALANLLVLTRENFDISSIRELQSEGEEAVLWRANREAAFMALTMNYASMIHLYHQQNAALTQLSKTLNACSLSGPAPDDDVNDALAAFSTGLPMSMPAIPMPSMSTQEPTALQPQVAYNPSFEQYDFSDPFGQPLSLGMGQPALELTQPLPAAALLLARVPSHHVAASVAAAQDIMALTRSDYDHQRARSAAASRAASRGPSSAGSSPVSPSGGPPFSQPYAYRRGGPSSSGGARRSSPSARLPVVIPCPTNPHRPSHAPFFSCSQVISAYGLMLALITSSGAMDGEAGDGGAALWRDMELRSDLEMVEETLRRQATVWKIAGDLGAKVRHFRAQIESSMMYSG